MSILHSFRSNLSCTLVATSVYTVLLANPNVASLAQSLPISLSTVQMPDTVFGCLSTNSATLEADGSYYETHTFVGNAGEVLYIELFSEDFNTFFDTYFVLLGPDGQKITASDDGALSTNSKMVVGLPSSGIYTLIAKTFELGQTGRYRIELRAATATDQTLAQADQLSRQTIALYVRGHYAEALPLAEKALAINESVLHPNHVAIVRALNNLALLYEAMGRFGEAEPLRLRALGTDETQQGPNHPNTATSLNNLALLYMSMGRYGQAEPLFQQALTIDETALGYEHPDTARDLNNLASLYMMMGRYEEAEPLQHRALQIYHMTLGPDHPDAVISLKNLTSICESMDSRCGGVWQQSYSRPLVFNEAQWGLNHPDTCLSLNNLARLYKSMGSYVEVGQFYQHALAIDETQLGLDHPITATGLNNLALLYESMGRYGQAESLFQRALTINQKNYGGPYNPTVVKDLGNLARLYVSMGRYEEAEPLQEQALGMIEAQPQLYLDDLELVKNLNNLALLYMLTYRYEEAEPLLRRTLYINTMLRGPNDPDTASSMFGLASVYVMMNRYEEAERLFRSALNIDSMQLGHLHLTTISVRNDLASLYELMGRYEEAEKLQTEALEINKGQLGWTHPETANSMINLALLNWRQGKFQSAFNYLQQGLTVEETVITRNLINGSDANARYYLTTVSASTDKAISLHLNNLINNNEAAHLALTTILQRKGRILDLFTNLRAQLADDPEALKLLEELSTVNTELAKLTFNPPTETASDTYQAQFSNLQERIRILEDQLSRRSTDFENITVSPIFADIQTALPPEAKLVEFIRYRPFNPIESTQDRFGAPRYAAYILQHDGTIQGIDLGSAEAIEQAVRSFSTDLASLETPLGQVKENARILESLVITPVRKALGETTTIFVSPDGALNLIPFEALVDESGDYLVKRYQFHYLTAGRDLMRLGGTTERGNPALLVGNPTYGRPGELAAQSDTRAIDFENRIFPALPGTQAEVDLIASKLVGAQVYTQTNATEVVLKQQQSPSILHIATHGFFEPSDSVLNPLLQSGLILAGASAGGQSGPDQDGILTALEVTGMNLSGTQLVVLSACETGLGTLEAGEGVYGLRRALVLAGSQTQVISLWKIEDTATQKLMVDYYDRLLSGAARNQALRETQLAFLNSGDYSHPYYWAAFIGSGDWRPLQL